MNAMTERVTGITPFREPGLVETGRQMSMKGLPELQEEWLLA